MKDNLKYLKLNLFLFLLLIISTLLFSVDVSAANKDMFCSQEEIQNFEEMGLDKSSIFYFLSEGKVYNVYSWYNDNIYYNDSNYEFKIENNYMTIGSFDEEGRGSIDGYSPKINMYDYKDSCILYVNNDNKIYVEDKQDTFLTNEGVKIVNSFSDCLESSSNKVIGNICALMIVSNEMINASFSSSFLTILFGVFIFSSSLIIIYIVSEVFKKR